MRYPKFLQGGGRIGFIAPSFGCSTEPYKSLFIAAQERFAKLGYGLVLGPNAYADAGIGKSNTPELCGAEINDFFLNDRSDAIISCGGGETMCEDLPFVDFDAISKAEPKWYMGYSDNTNLTFTLPVLTDTAAIYGPCVSEYGMKDLEPSLRDAFDVMCGKTAEAHNYAKWEKEQLKSPENPYAGYNLTEDFKLRAFVGPNEITASTEPCRVKGRLIGGCLDCLANLVGTPYDRVSDFAARYADDGILWFLESCDLNVMSIRRALWNLDQAGWFEHASGFLIGRPLQFDDAWGDFDRIAAVVGILSKYNVPIILDLDIGHLPPMMPIVSGALGEAEVLGNSFRMKYIYK
ncbi:MAG: LD-carboxypeptidase [Lachnospiraceae bacterium]|nr:LD-carboxypeptidase [Lachnospiraceae bacterium]